MKVTKRDEGIYTIDDVLAPRYYENLLEEFIPAHNNWVFRKKEWNAGSKDDKYPMWGNLMKATNVMNKDEYTYDMLGDNHVLLNVGSVGTLIVGSILKKPVELMRVNTNIQFMGQESTFHQDGFPDNWTLCIFVSERWDGEWGGEFLCENSFGDYSGFAYKPNCAILFRASLMHKGNAPNRFAPLERKSIAYTYREY